SGDLDLTTSAPPEETERILAGWGDAHWDMGREFGTIGVRRGETTVEVTTYRADAYDGTTRKPVVAFGDDLEDDLVRRDFTVNAMALRLPGLELVDPHGGMLDLAAQRLRTPSAPEVSFSDDPLRMMRAARFVAQLGLTPSPPNGSATSSSSSSSVTTRSPACASSSRRAWPARCCRSCPPFVSRSTSTTGTRTSTSTPSPCCSRRSTWRARPARTGVTGSSP